MTKQFLVDQLTKNYSKDSAEGLNAIYVFKVGGDSYSLKLQDGECNVTEGITEGANVTLAADEETWKSIVSGDLAAQMAFMMGKLSVEGDFSLALKLPQIFNL
ncbi:MAG: SCP2 sterol-binding domain-containing protein [Candidatus Caenarcaniphilales bacterium]|nr:SCP2 sterol-binding domain-containing protein [Candidatus Caenarcaniphilales bacterium]